MKKPNIMVVDDESLMLNLLRDFLSSQGYEVTCHSSAIEALKSLDRTAPEAPLAVIAHMRMYPMSGLELLAAMTKGHPSIPVLLFTGANNPDDETAALEAGAAFYLTKPFSLTALKSALNTLKQRQSQANPQR